MSDATKPQESAGRLLVPEKIDGSVARYQITLDVEVTALHPGAPGEYVLVEVSRNVPGRGNVGFKLPGTPRRDAFADESGVFAALAAHPQLVARRLAEMLGG